MIVELIENVGGYDEGTGRPMTGIAGLRGTATMATEPDRFDFRVTTTSGVQNGSVFFADLVTADQFRRVCDACGDIMEAADLILFMHPDCWLANESAARRDHEPADPDEMRD